jgi:hypothetical protein
MRILRSVALCCSLSALSWAQSVPAIRAGVDVEIAKTSEDGTLLRWKITNRLPTAIYVYDFYLWGPAYHVERLADRVLIDTTPVVELRSCPPTRFPPVLLVVVGPHRRISGEFSDSEISGLGGKQVAIRVAVGTDPYSVVEQAKKFAASRCRYSPYDAIVQWGTIIESNAIRW